MSPASLSTSRVGIIFGTDTGNTEDVAEKLMAELESYGVVAEIINVTEASSELIAAFDLAIMGIPTWNFGGIQADWEDFEETLALTDLTGKMVALYGLGDQFGYGDFFVDAMGWLQEKLQPTGVSFIGYWPTEGYEFEESRAVNEDKSLFCGLAIDEDQQFELTDKRIGDWVRQVVSEYESAAAA